MFGVNGAGQLFNKWQWTAGAQWSDGWNLLGDGVNSIAVTHNKAGYLEIFATTPANTVKYRSQGPAGWSAWVPMEGGIHEIAAHVNGQGLIELVGVNTIGQVWHKRETAANSNVWTAWQIMPGEQAAVAVALNQDGRLEIFAANKQGQPWHSRETAASSDTWQPWEQFDGGISQVAAATTAGGKIEFWGVNNAGFIYHRWQRTPGGDWSNWEQVAGRLRRTNPFVTVPNLMSGVDDPNARSLIAGAELTVGAVTTSYTDEKGDRGLVGSQNPAPGTIVRFGTRVDYSIQSWTGVTCGSPGRPPCN
jgi:hypothetical protein